jgi:hypothetical protein
VHQSLHDGYNTGTAAAALRSHACHSARAPRPQPFAHAALHHRPLRYVLEDGASSFEEFPVAVRPLHDFMMELQTATEVPVLVVVDGWNRARASRCGMPEHL